MSERKQLFFPDILPKEDVEDNMNFRKGVCGGSGGGVGGGVWRVAVGVLSVLLAVIDSLVEVEEGGTYSLFCVGVLGLVQTRSPHFVFNLFCQIHWELVMTLTFSQNEKIYIGKKSDNL